MHSSKSSRKRPPPQKKKSWRKRTAARGVRRLLRPRHAHTHIFVPMASKGKAPAKAGASAPAPVTKTPGGGAAAAAAAAAKVRAAPPLERRGEPATAGRSPTPARLLCPCARRPFPPRRLLTPKCWRRARRWPQSLAPPACVRRLFPPRRAGAPALRPCRAARRGPPSRPVRARLASAGAHWRQGHGTAEAGGGAQGGEHGRQEAGLCAQGEREGGG